MRRKNAYIAIKTVIFLVVGILLYQEVNAVFVEKSTYGRYLNFKHMENVDLLILGSSHSDNGIGAAAIETGLEERLGRKTDVYNYSIFGMRLEQMYYVLQEVLKTQKPKLIVIEAFSFVESEPENYEILTRRAFDYFPLSMNKIEAVKYCADGKYETYLIPLLKYHTRWKELTAEDIGYRFRSSLWEKDGRAYNTTKQVMERKDDYFSQDFSVINEEQALGKRAEEKLQDILQLAEKNQIKVLFLSIPFKQQLGVSSVDSIRMNNYVDAKYVNGESVRMLDLNRKANEIKFGYKYLKDEGHSNRKGAKKVTNILIDYISEQYKEWL